LNHPAAGIQEDDCADFIPWQPDNHQVCPKLGMSLSPISFCGRCRGGNRDIGEVFAYLNPRVAEEAK
jgi:hypothetical protein